MNGITALLVSLNSLEVYVLKSSLVEYINPQTARCDNSLHHLLCRPAAIFIGEALITLTLLVAVETIFIIKNG